jgi:hypothetical protein
MRPLGEKIVDALFSAAEFSFLTYGGNELMCSQAAASDIRCSGMLTVLDFAVVGCMVNSPVLQPEIGRPFLWSQSLIQQKAV